MWFLLQGSIIFAVCAANIAYHWTPNGLIPALAGAGLAYIATEIVSSLRLKNKRTSDSR